MTIPSRRNYRWLDYLRLLIAVGLTVALAIYTQGLVAAEHASDASAPHLVGNPLPTVIGTGAVVSLLIILSTIVRARVDRKSDETDTRYQELFDGMPLPMWIYDVETLRILAVNHAAIAHYGYSSDEFHALTLRDLRPPDATPSLPVTIATLRRSYQQAGTFQHRKKDGTVIDVEVSAHPMQFHGCAAEAIAATDITSRLRAQADTRESEERFRQMAEHITESFFVADVRTRVALYTSPTWAEIWGRPMSEATDPDIWLNAVHEEDRGAVIESQSAVCRGEDAVNVFRVIRPDGTTRWARGRCFPVRDADGVVYRMVGVVEDITELRQAEERFAQSQKMEAVGRLAGGIAHDFNNLLTVILGEADQLNDILAPDTPASRSAQEIRMSGERAATLTGQLLAFSRRQLVEPVVFALTTAVGDMSTMLSRLIGEDIDLVTSFAHDTWTVRADPGHIEQVVANLVVNGRDAMPNGGTLTIATRNVTLDEEYASSHAEVRPGDYVLLSVGDTGTGMSEEVRARLFEPFFTTKAPGKGTGLGLATCYGIAKQSNGHIAAYSELGIGTTIKVYLPRGSAPAVVARPAAAAPSLPRGHETILVVEDEAAVRRIVVRLLSAQGYQLLEAQNGAEAAAITATHPGNIDLLLTDVVLPGAGGREIAEQAQLQRPGIKVLFTSGYTDDVMLQHRLLEHDATLLQKPFTREAIARTVRAVLDAPMPEFAGA